MAATMLVRVFRPLSSTCCAVALTSGLAACVAANWLAAMVNSLAMKASRMKFLAAPASAATAGAAAGAAASTGVAGSTAGVVAGAVTGGTVGWASCAGAVVWAEALRAAAAITAARIPETL